VDFLKLEINDLLLDELNPRFHINLAEVTEESIFNYMKEYENLSRLVESIKKIGFKQVGERVIAIKENNKYIVVEGNRRVCSLKAIHNFLGNGIFASEDKELLKNTQFIDVDVVESRESIQEYLAARHIEGIREWKPEAKRKFYANQYISGKSISQVLEMTPEKRTDVTKYIRQYVFLQDFKLKSKINHIEKPSIIYERIYLRFIEIGILNAIEVTENYKTTKVNYKYDYLDKSQVETFVWEIGKATVVNEDIKSRTINKANDFRVLMKDIEFRNKYPELTALYDEIEKKVKINKYVPKQLITQKFVDIPMPLKNIIDYSGLSTTPTIKIVNENRESINDISNAPIGRYIITIDNHNYDFEIMQVLEPKIKFNEYSLNNIRVGNSVDLKSTIIIYDIHGELLQDLDTNDVVISVEPSDKANITNKNRMCVNQSGQYNLKVTYTCNGDINYKKETKMFFDVEPVTATTQNNEPQKYFDFKFIKQANLSENSSVSDHLINELEFAYQRKYSYIFAAALRSLIESILYELTENAKKVNPLSRFSSTNIKTFDNRVKEFKEFKKSADFKKIIETVAVSKKLPFSDMKNYFNAQLSDEQLNFVIETLHLGAHKSMTLISDANLEKIKLNIIAWLELIFIIKDTNYFV
jgi:hypothetical protein